MSSLFAAKETSVDVAKVPDLLGLDGIFTLKVAQSVVALRSSPGRSNMHLALPLHQQEA